MRSFLGESIKNKKSEKLLYTHVISIITV